ncbi:MAG: head decoration protein [Pseudomonadota bacterium]
MANVTPPYSDPGRAAFEVLDTYLQSFLLAGTHPELAPAFSYPAANATVLAQFAVVGLDGSGEIVAATQDETVKAIGVLAHAVAENDGRAHVWYSGCFNIDALVWDASFTTDAEKLAAFAGAPTPTTILARKR